MEVDLLVRARTTRARGDEVAVEGLDRERPDELERRRGRVRSERLGATRGRLGERIDRADHAGPDRLRHLGHDRVDVDDRPDSRRSRDDRVAQRLEHRRAPLVEVAQCARHPADSTPQARAPACRCGRGWLSMRAWQRGGILVKSYACRHPRQDPRARRPDRPVRRERPARSDRLAQLGAWEGAAHACHRGGRLQGRRQVRRSVGVRHLSQARPSAVCGSGHARVRAALVRRAHARDRRRARSEYRAHRSGGAPCHGRGRSVAARQGSAARAARGGRGRQPADHELDGGAVPDRGLGQARPPRATAGRGARAPVAGGDSRVPRRRGRPGGRVGGANGPSDRGRAKARRNGARGGALRGAGNRSDRRAVPFVPLVLRADHDRRRNRARAQPADRGGVHHPGPRSGRRLCRARRSRCSSRGC